MLKPAKHLSVAQLLVLSTAAQRLDRMIMPLPGGLRVRGASQLGLLTSLLKLLLVEELHTSVLTFSWRHDDQGQHFALALTEAGLAVVGISPATDTNSPTNLIVAPAAQGNTPSEIAAGSETAPGPGSASGAAPPRGKLGQVLSAVSAAQGATTQELTALTGWQTHTTRAALTRLRQRGYPLELIKKADRIAYCLTVTAGS